MMAKMIRLKTTLILAKPESNDVAIAVTLQIHQQTLGY